MYVRSWASVTPVSSSQKFTVLLKGWASKTSINHNYYGGFRSSFITFYYHELNLHTKHPNFLSFLWRIMLPKWYFSRCFSSLSTQFPGPSHGDSDTVGLMGSISIISTPGDTDLGSIRHSLDIKFQICKMIYFKGMLYNIVVRIDNIVD